MLVVIKCDHNYFEFIGVELEVLGAVIPRNPWYLDIERDEEARIAQRGPIKECGSNREAYVNS